MQVDPVQIFPQKVSEARKPMAKLSGLLWSALAFLLLAAGAAHAQDRGSLRGTIKDPSGALVSGASVTLKNDATRVTHKTLTDAAGSFSVTRLPAGQYTIRVQREGFATLSKPVLVVSPGTVTVDFTLGVGPANVSVDVRASREEIADTLSPGAVTVVYPDDTKGEFKSLPDLLDEVPGVYVRRVSGSSNQYTTASVRGGAPTQVNIYIDGVPFNLATQAAADLSTFDINNVERIEVYRGIVPARFSGAPVGGAINIVTKKPTSWSLNGSSGFRTLGGRQDSINVNGPLLRGKFLFGADLDKSTGDFKYTDFVDQQVQTLILPADSYWGAVPYCQAGLTGANGANVGACTGLINKTRLNNSSSKDNLLTKWQTDRISVKWSYLYQNRKLPYDTDASPGVDDPNGGVYFTSPRYQRLNQNEGVVAWNQHYGKLTASLTGTVMDQDNQYYWQYYADFNEFGGQHSWYHTRRYGGIADLSYALDDHGPITQLFEFHGDWTQEGMHTMIANTSYSGVTGIGFPPELSRHTWSFQLQDTITLHFLHNLEITPVGRMQRLSSPVMGALYDAFSPVNGDQGWKPTGSIAVKERFGHGWQAFSTYGRYVRYPNLYEIYGDAIYIIPLINSDGSSIPLQAELGRTFDLGVGWDGTITDKLSGHTRITLFHRQTDDNITLVQNALHAHYQNTGDTINRGIEFEGNLHYGNFASLQTAVTVQDGVYTDQGFIEGNGQPIQAAPGLKIPELNTPYGNGDARLDLHFLHGGALTTFFEAKYVSQNVIDITSSNVFVPTGGGNSVDTFVYAGRQEYERPLTTLDLGIHLKLPHGGAFSSGVTDLLNRGPNQAYGGYVGSGGYADGIHLTWYTCSSTGVKYPSLPSPSVCPSNDVITSLAIAPVKQNLSYPQQGRTVYVTLAWDFKGWRPRTK
jgi:vitamin B12 transporter